MMSPQKNIRILIAEDEFLPAARIRKTLETAGYEVVGDAADGFQAVAMTESLRPDVVLMDINMPDMDGIEATRQIQANNPTPVVILTAYQNPKLVSRAKDAGAGAYLIKPPDARELDRTIEIALQRFADMMALRDLNIRLCEEIEMRKETERQLTTALEDKANLMKELLHRTKNNLASIGSFLAIQSTLTEDGKVRHIFAKIKNCAYSMAHVQEMLYKTGNFVDVDLGSYIFDIANAVFRNYLLTKDWVRLQTDLEPVTVSADTAITCGMIINELISNAVKYAFQDQRRGEISVSLYDVGEGRISLGVSDDGVGFPEGFDTDNADTIGLRLVSGFAEQLNGCVEFRNSNPGTAVVVRFKESSAEKRQGM